MPKRIVVAIDCDIARKGLVAIARGATGYSVLERKGLQCIQECDLSIENIVVFDLLERTSAQEFQQNHAKHKIELVAFAHSKNDTYEFNGLCISQCDNELAINNLFNSIFPQKAERDETTTSEELSTRERDVLRLVAMGFPNKEIADKLFISIHTVVTHRKNITEKLGIKSISGLTVFAIINGIIDSDSINVSELI